MYFCILSLRLPFCSFFNEGNGGERMNQKTDTTGGELLED